METGEYFLSERDRTNHKLGEKMKKQQEKRAQKLIDSAKKYEVPDVAEEV